MATGQPLPQVGEGLIPPNAQLRALPSPDVPSRLRTYPVGSTSAGRFPSPAERRTTMRRIQQAVERPMAALTATVTSGDALPMLMALSQPSSIPSAIGL